MLNELSNRIEFIVFGAFCVFIFLNIKIFSAFNFKQKEILKTTKIKSNDRLEIIDRNGRYLAINKNVYNLYIEPMRIIKIEDNLNKINKILNIEKWKFDKVKELIYRSKKHHKHGIILLKTNVTEAERELLIKNGVFGVYFEKYKIRFYPYSNAAVHIVGFTSFYSGQEGLSGVESSFDSYLRLQDNKFPIQLSIDIEKQEIARNILMKYVQKYKAKGGAAVISKIDGEILAAVSLPDFDPHNYQQASDEKLFNRFSLGVYELGSVCKLFLGAYSNEKGVDIFDLYKREEFKIDSFTIHDIDRKEKVGGSMSLFDGIVHSSNVICAKAIERIGFKDYYKFFQKIGMKHRIDLEIREVSKPIFPKKESLINAVTMSYGHGFAVPILNYVRSINSILNNGKQVELTLLKRKKHESSDNEHEDRVVSQETSDIIKDIMRRALAVNKRQIFEQYKVGGKTGTSIKIDSNGVYNRAKLNVQLVAAFPIDKPEYSIFIMLDEPAGEVNFRSIRGGDLVPALEEFITEIFN